MLVHAKITLRSSVVHVGESLGIDQVFHRSKWILDDGRVIEVPTVTGNSIRGLLRDCSAAFMLDELNAPPLPVSAIHFLFSGGALTKSGGQSIDLKRISRFRSLVPMASLWGGSIGNFMLDGKWSSGMLIPIAKETRSLLPEKYADEANTSVYDYMQTESYTRRDDMKRKVGELYAESPDASQSPQQMRYFVETMSPGTPMYWWFRVANDATALEVQSLFAGFIRWAEHPHIGGKSNVGHGLCQVQFDNGCEITPESANLPDVSEYIAHLLANKNEILSELANV